MNSKANRTWKKTTTVTAIMADGEHKLLTLGGGESLERFVGKMAIDYGRNLLRVAFCNSEICDQTGEIADLTTSWYTKAELAEAADRYNLTAPLRG